MRLPDDLRRRIAYRVERFIGDCGSGRGLPCRYCRDFMVADIIREAIADGRLNPNEPLPHDPEH